MNNSFFNIRIFSILIFTFLLYACANLRPSPPHPGIRKYDLAGRWTSGIQQLYISCYGRFELDQNDGGSITSQVRVGVVDFKEKKHNVPSSKYSGDVKEVTDSQLTINSIFEITYRFLPPSGLPVKMRLDEDVWTRVEDFDCSGV